MILYFNCPILNPLLNQNWLVGNLPTVTSLFFGHYPNDDNQQTPTGLAATIL